jgi:inorganic pyrophosphatase
MVVQVFIEIERGSDQKHEWNSRTRQLELDRVTPQPYPYAYGFIPGTLAEDGDDLDALIVSADAEIKQGQTYTAHIVGALRMEDEKGMDEKVLCVLTEGEELTTGAATVIEQFFATYKEGVPGRWSRTGGFMTAAEAALLVERCVERSKAMVPSHRS